MSNVLFIVESPFSDRDYKRFGVDILIQQGFSVHVFDCTPMLNPRLYNKHSSVKKEKNFSYQTILHSDKFVEHLKLIGGQITAIALIQFRLSSYKIFKILLRHKIEYSLIMFPPVPVETLRAKIPLVKRINTKIRSMSLNTLRTLAIYRLPLWMLRIESARYVFCAVDLPYNQPKIVDNRSERCIIHSLDYEIYQEDLAQSDNGYGSIVFLDQSLPIHPDFINEPVTNLPPKEKYFNEMSDFFETLEKKFKVKVVVSAHPRSDILLLSKFYKGREVFINRTNDLVKNSVFCVAHYSNAINYAALHNKPLKLVTTNDIDKCSLMRSCIDAYASYFNASVFNISNRSDLCFFNDLDVDEKIYKRFVNNFVKSEGSSVDKYWITVGRKIGLLFK